MKIPTLKIALLFAGGLLFSLIFWHEKIAINALIYDGFILLSVFKLYPVAFSRQVVKWLLAAHVVTLVAVIVHNTLLSKLAFSTTLLLLVVLIQFWHRSVWYAAASAIGNYSLLAFSFIEEISRIKKTGKKSFWVKKISFFLIIPIMITFVFFLVYLLSNTVLQDVINSMAIALDRFFSRFFAWVNWPYFVFVAFGLFITGGLLLKMRSNYFSEKEFTKQDDLRRKRKSLKSRNKVASLDLLTLFMGRFANGIMALRNENTIGLISLVMLNILLLFINVIDIKYVWFGFTYTANVSLTKYVHEGAGLLIFSIVLAMLVLLFFFRGNLNFYKKNICLCFLTYACIF